METVLGESSRKRRSVHKLQWHYLRFAWVFTSLVAQRVRRLPTMREIQVQSLGREEPLEKEMAPHSSTVISPSTATREEAPFATPRESLGLP